MAGDDVRMAHKLGGYRARSDLPAHGGINGGVDPVDRLLEKKLLNDLNRNPPPKQAPHPRSRITSTRRPAAEGSGGEGDQQELMSSMVRRLATAERELKLKSQQLLRVKGERDGLLDKVEELEQQLKERDEQIVGLEAQQAAPALPEDADASEIIAAMRKENLLLRQQNDRAWNEVGHLKEFLNDYGLVWVGEKDGEGSYDDEDSEEEARPGGGALLGARAAADQKPAWRQYGAGLDAADDEWRPAASRAPAAQEQPSSTSASSVPVKISELEKAIKELNGVAGDGCFDIVKGTKGEAQLRPPEPVYLVVHSDGLRLHNLKFCKWDEKVCRSMLDDILDGYFPSALKHEFPGGVPLRLVDKSNQAFPVGFRAFQGEGNVLSGSPSKPNPNGGYTLGGRASQPHTGAPPVHRPPGMIRGMDDVLGAQPAHQTPANFLDKLPQAVIRNGKVIPVREDIAGMIQPPRSDLEMAMVNTPVDDLLNTMQRNHAGPRIPSAPRTGVASPRSAAMRLSNGHTSPSSQQITTLQVKREDGAKVYIIKLRFEDTIQDLHDALDSHRAKEPGFAQIRYQVRSAFPARTYDDASETLETAGLVPNAALFLRGL